MLRDTWLLLTLRWQIARNTFRARKTAAQVLSVLGAVVMLVFFGGISAGVGFVAGFVLRRFPEAQLEPVLPGVMLAGVSVLLLFSSFGIALGSLYLASDLELLMTAPVDRRAVFVSKILDGMAFNYLIVTVAALPALVTYGIGLGYGALYYLLAVVAMLGTPLFPAAVGAILVMLVARFAPARRVAEVLGVMGALFGLSCAFLGQTSTFWFRQLQRPGPEGEAWLRNLRAIAELPLPPFLAGSGLAAAGVGDWPGALSGLALFFIFTFGFFAACAAVADTLYAAGWVRMQSSGSAKRGKERAERAARRTGLLGRVPADLAIALKDWRVIPRDLRNFAQMLAPLLIVPVIYINLLLDGVGRRPGRGPASGFVTDSGLDFTGVLIAGGVVFAATSVFGRLANTAISMEGKSYWILKAAPLSGGELLRGKFIAAIVPYAVLSTVLLFGAAIWRGFDPLWLLYGWYGVQLLGAGMLAAGVALAVPWARLDWDDPRRMSSGWGNILSLVASVFLFIVGGLLLCIPLVVVAFDPSLVPVAMLAGALLATALTVGVSWALLAFALKKLSDVG